MAGNHICFKLSVAFYKSQFMCKIIPPSMENCNDSEFYTSCMIELELLVKLKVKIKNDESLSARLYRHCTTCLHYIILTPC